MLALTSAAAVCRILFHLVCRRSGDWSPQSHFSAIAISMLERIGAVSMILGLVLGMASWAWLFSRFLFHRLGRLTGRWWRTPILLLVISHGLVLGPIAINSTLIRLVDLGPHQAIVDGERHLTLTGWDRTDYSKIRQFPDTIVLQMANRDVDDQTLQFVRGLTRLRELDLNDTAVTDAGLTVISHLPQLRDLRLSRTRITDAGFREHLLNKESLRNLDLVGTEVASKTVREWKAAKPGRNALR